MPTVTVEEKTRTDLDRLGEKMGHNTRNGVIRELITFWRAMNDRPEAADD